ncbi:putative Ankyrin repeats (3 copies) [Trypanosoma vivax]|uniref:Uncharacterized protein n=1 Tax=Trypanosoma vivax (strain Y486) TaxID=1055687 RepID=G0U653_TRYVY|nr:hypothetical protein TRVL_06826 [Trypanosoma vivax]KAH8608228.1 putative Ankyrin repeats (3 copies) [Trypanosoma vivax]CCC51356.1 conserved hypothetical protein [Trypanosoma vivax Y486]
MNHSCSGDSPAAPLGKALSANELGHSIGGYAFKWNCTDGTSVGLDRSAFFSLGDYDYPDHHLLRSFCTAPVLPWSTFDCIRRKNVTVSGNHKQDVSADFERLFASANNHNTHQGANCGTTNTSATGQCDIKTSFKSIGALLEDELPELSVDRGGRPHDGTTFLLLAVLAGDMELAHRCLVLGAEANNMAFLSDPNVSVNQMQHGYSPMFIAVIKGHIEMMSLLHQFGGSVQVYDRWGRSPLHAAVALGDTVVVRWLREKGAPRCIGNGSMALQDSPLYSNLAPPNPALEPRPGQTMSLWEGSTASVMDAEGVECTKAVLCHCHSGRPKGYCGCVDDMFLRWSYDRVHSQWQVGINFGKLAALHASRESVNRKVS